MHHIRKPCLSDLSDIGLAILLSVLCKYYVEFIYLIIEHTAISKKLLASMAENKYI